MHDIHIPRLTQITTTPSEMNSSPISIRIIHGAHLAAGLRGGGSGLGEKLDSE
jgi:hypothetical protein